MELPSDIFAELAAGASYDRSSPGASQRETPRAKLSVEVTLLRLGVKDAKPVPAKLVDLSLRGAGIESQEPIHVNERFAIRIKRPSGAIMWLQCVGVRWSVLGKNRCSVGAKFLRLVTPGKGEEPGVAAA